MSKLEDHDFVATDQDILDLATTVLAASQQSDTGRRNYLKTLVATAQKELGVAPRLRSTPGADKLDAEATKQQIAALNAVHERFYAIVTQVAQESVPVGTKDRGIEVNRRTNFARTALSAIRRWVRAGNDLTALAARSVTKAALAIDAPRRRRPTPAALSRRVRRDGKHLVSTFRLWVSQDQEQASAGLRALVDRLTSLMPRRTGRPRLVEQVKKAA